MKIHHLRNATFVIESSEKYILIDPMLGAVGSLPTFTYIRNNPKRNPIVALPDNTQEILSKVTHCLITHSQKWGIELLTHTDHLDKAGKAFLIKNNIPVTTMNDDIAHLKKTGLNIEKGLEFHKTVEYLDGRITAIPAKHGHSWMHKFMANGAGYIIELLDEPSVYISGDTVLTQDVKNALKDFKPDIAVIASGSAYLDVGGYILMSPKEIKEFISLAPNKVIANHVEALNHCPTTRDGLKNELLKSGLLDKTLIPKDGETLTIEL